MIPLIIIVCYVLNLLFNRWLCFRIIEKDKDMYPNPPLTSMCFLSLFGTLILIIVYFVSSDFFTPKHLRKQ